MIAAGFSLTRLLLGLFTALVLAFLFAPIVVIIASAFTASEYVAFPPEGLSLKWFRSAFANLEFVEGFRTSLMLALANAVLATVVGGAAALGLARSRFRGHQIVTTFLLSPLMLPAVVIGVAVLQLLAAIGFLGSVPGVLVGHMLVTVPYAVRLIGVSLGGFEWDLNRAALNLGATPWRALREVVLPLIRPGLAASAMFAFILSFDEVTISLFTTGPKVSTLPVVIFRWVEYSYDPVIAAASAITVLVAVIGVAVIEWTLGVERVFGGDPGAAR